VLSCALMILYTLQDFRLLLSFFPQRALDFLFFRKKESSKEKTLRCISHRAAFGCFAVTTHQLAALKQGLPRSQSFRKLLFRFETTRRKSFQIIAAFSCLQIARCCATLLVAPLLSLRA